MPQFAVLIHDSPRGLHYDFMLEAGDVLKTWALPQEPTPGLEMPCEALADHRPMYLDYEGPISGGRGTVAGWDRGTYSIEVWSDEAIVIGITGSKWEDGWSCSGRQGNGGSCGNRKLSRSRLGRAASRCKVVPGGFLTRSADGQKKTRSRKIIRGLPRFEPRSTSSVYFSIPLRLCAFRENSCRLTRFFVLTFRSWLSRILTSPIPWFRRQPTALLPSESYRCERSASDCPWRK